MAYQVPMDLIEHARILLREEAGLESYNPSDPSFPSLPTVEAVIAGYDPSPDHPRCKHCNAKLLRGSQSLICVYCGREHKREFPTEPISFKSTIGFRWLVDSLGLNGSEIIEPPDEDKQINRGLNSVNDISLSDFLGLEMKWPVESERFGLTDADEFQNHGRRPLRLAGVDFIHTFSEEKSENSSSLPVEQAISNEKSIEFEACTVQGSFDFSENRDLSGGDVKSSVVKNGDTFSAWEADFQAASSVAPFPHDDSEISHLSSISSVDHESHMYSLFGPLKGFEEGTSIHDSSSHVPHTIKENETDDRRNSFSVASVLERKHDVSIVLEHGLVVEANRQSEQHLGSLKSVNKLKGVGYDSIDSWNDIKSATDIGNDQWVSSSTVVSRSAKISGNDDSSDVWNGFTSYTGSGDNKHLTRSINVPEEGVSFDTWNDLMSSGSVSNGQLINRGLISAEEISVSVGNDMFGPQNDVTDQKCSQEGQQEVPVEIAVSIETANQEDEDSFSLSERGDRLQNMGTLLSTDKMNEKGEDSLNLWSDLMGSTVAQHNPGGSNSVELAGEQLSGEGGDTADGWGNITSLTSSWSGKETNSTETHGDNKIIKDDSFDSWNDFTSSACIPESKSLNEDTTQAWSDISNQNIQQKMVNQQAPEYKAIVEDDDSFNSWSGLGSSSNAVSDKLPSPTDASINNITSEHISNQSWNDLSSSTFQPEQEHTGRMKVSENDTVKDDDVFNSWGSFGGPSVSQSTQWQNSEARMSEADGLSDDWSSRLTDSKSIFDNQLKVGGDRVSVPAITKISDNYDSFDAWSDFTSSTTLPGYQSQSLEESHIDDDKQAVTEGDSFDVWSLLMTSSSSQCINQNVTSTDESSLLNSSGNQKTPDSDSTLQPVLFPDASDDQNVSASLGFSSSEALDLFRMKDGNAKSSIDAEQSQKDEHVSGQASGKKPIDAETLISQMHDLSFMLESSLSVPKNVD